MRYDQGTLFLLDQQKLPSQSEWLELSTLEDIADAIESMAVRGAPAIGCAAAYAVAIQAGRSAFDDWRSYRKTFDAGLARLEATRPTAVNLFKTLAEAKKLAEAFTPETSRKTVCDRLESFAEQTFQMDRRTCQQIGDHGARLVAQTRKVQVLTHCNAGALATAGYGTALGVIRSLFRDEKLEHVYVDETRPWLQGARLTAYELCQEEIPFSLIVDAAAGSLFAQGRIDMVVVGADRITCNGDTANKIGTYPLAVLARYHGVPFYVAAPTWTFDKERQSGDQITIESRLPEEITHIANIPLSPAGTRAFNPAFDVTPANLISAFITEHGMIEEPFAETVPAFVDRYL